MGLYDTFIGVCPGCKKFIGVQTKLLGNTLDNIKEGDSFAADVPDTTYILKCKGNCFECGHFLHARIENNIFTGFTKDDATYEELQWGDIMKLR